MTAPSFLCIGAQKSGTTWLYRALERHPDVWLPPVKELHFFDEKIHSSDTLSDLLHGSDPIHQRWRRQVAHERTRRARHDAGGIEEQARREWTGRYFFESPSVDWYRSLFAGADGPRGEVTPDYATISDESLELVRSTAPGVRVVYLIRNPIERDWSAIMMSVRRGKRTPDTVLRMSRQHVRYAHHIRRWSAALGPGRVYVGFFDDITTNPHDLLADILRFIGADDRHIDLPKGRPNSGNIETMPARFAVALADEMGPSIADLAHRFGGAADRWSRTASWLSSERPTGDLEYPLLDPDGPPTPRAEISSLII